MIICVCNTKGGVGKTTTAMALAAEFSKTGKSRVIDTDSQGSATYWKARTDKNSVQLPFPVEIGNAYSLSAMHVEPDETVLIDAAPGESKTTKVAINHADLVIIPSDTSELDTVRMWETWESAAGHKRIILLTKVDPRTVLYKEAKAAILEDDEVVMFDTEIPYREATKRALGTNPDALTGYGELAAEIKDLMK